MANISTRLTRLENARVTSRGIRLFRSHDSVSFYESLDDGRMWTRGELDALGDDGWQVIALCYVSDWRGETTR